MTIRYKQLCSIWVCLFLAVQTYGKIIYVNTNALGQNDGTSWQNAFTELDLALSNIQPGDQIWVAKGVYYPTHSSNRHLSFVIPDGISLLGGFPANGTPGLSDRDPSLYVTTLSGDIDQDQTLNNNSYTIIYTLDVSSNTLIDGFTISGGNADAVVSNAFPVKKENGGAAWFNESSTGAESGPTIKNCRFVGNKASNRGGGIFSMAGHSGKANYRIENSLFENNIASLGGGAIYNSQSGEGSECNPIIKNTEFTFNSSDGSGGAIYIDGGYYGEVSGLFENCQFMNNTVNELEGGAIFLNAVFNGKANTIFTGCRFINNQALNGSGGAIYVDASVEGVANFNLTSCVLKGNQSNV